MRIVKATTGAIVIAGAAFAGLHLTDRLLAAPDPGAERTADRTEAIPVETIAVTAARFTDSVRAVGTARARQAIDLMPQAGGRITRLAFHPGQQVSRGDVILELDSRAEEADLKSAEATLTEAEAAFERQQQLNRSGSASDAAYQTARATLLRAEAERDLAQVRLDDRMVRAPFDGVLGLTDLVEGQMLDSTTPVTTLDDLTVIEVDFGVSETLLPHIVEGQQVRLHSAAWPDRVFEGRITRIDTRVDAATRSIALRAEVPNSDRALAGGMFLQAELILDERDSPALPETAVTVEGDRHLALIARDNEAHRVEITVGEQTAGLIEVVSGLEIGAQIIVTNLHRVQPGSSVEAQPRVQPLQTAAERRTGADG
ncbi:efflux RND transporter periplasmic adaptor subunit [Paracoccus sp. (in: a-proteobacteria)]|uniref:efflux RND transporter periplasmic adaptor subunit n=1 Tax=Paracoccus sp. TaxID=267 RepID=UPI00396C96F3